ncbi:MAG: hypothetical protein A2033_10485 [Bacteroidetes bacterium GWA2_31_9]|nr:MAG: hypothetical protein A2033_10485 [Bacteroidetes bacterium GWA2_31_9]
MEKWREIFRLMYSPSNLELNNKKAENVISSFKNLHPELISNDVEIGISNVIEDEKGNPCDYFIIHIRHNNEFDSKLIPDLFDGIKIETTIADGE